MTVSALLGNPKPQWGDLTGAPQTAGTLTFNLAGSPQDDADGTTFTDYGGLTANDNPLSLNTRGEPESDGGVAVSIYGTDGISYDIYLKDSAGVVIWSILAHQTSAAVSLLRADLASTATDNGTLGFHLVFYPRTAAEVTAGVTPESFEYPPTNAFRYILTSLISGIMDGTGTTNLSVYLNNGYDAAKAAGGTKKLTFERGTYYHTAQLVWDAAVDILGDSRSGVTFLKNGNFTGIRITDGDGARYEEFTSNGDSGNGGIGIEVYTGHRIVMQRIATINHGSHGGIVRSGNLGRYVDIQTSANGGDGWRHESLTAEPAVSANACLYINVDTRSNALIGFNLEAGVSNHATMITAQNNTGVGVSINDDRNHITIYAESNGSASLLTASAQGNFVTIIEGNITDVGGIGNFNTIFSYNEAGQNKWHYRHLYAEDLTIQDRNNLTNPNPFLITDVSTATNHILEISDEGSSAIAGIVQFRHPAGNKINVDVTGDISTNNRILNNQVLTTTSGDATPDVGDANAYRLDGTTTITDLDSGTLGQSLFLEAIGSITITHTNGVIELSGQANYVMTAGDTLFLYMFVDQVWTEISRTVV